MAAKRKAISKRVRFAVFSRDGYCCRYCGESSENIKLVVDHVIPVCQGGTNDMENLISSCEPCNQGKAGKRISQTVPTDQDARRVQQEYLEQLDLAEKTRAIASFRMETRQEVCNYYCDLTGAKTINRRNLSTLINILEDEGVENLFHWMDSAFRNTGQNGADLVRYVCGIRNNINRESR